MLVINSIKPKIQDLLCKIALALRFFETNYLKCLNNFAAFCIDISTKQANHRRTLIYFVNFSAQGDEFFLIFL